MAKKYTPGELADKLYDIVCKSRDANTEFYDYVNDCGALEQAADLLLKLEPRPISEVPRDGEFLVVYKEIAPENKEVRSFFVSSYEDVCAELTDEYGPAKPTHFIDLSILVK